MLATTINKLRWSWRKNWPDIRGFAARHYPDFVLSDKTTALADEIPVFVFHSVTPEPFRAQLEYLKENGYVTLDAATLLKAVRGECAIPERAVVLTFDDGTYSLYSVAWPLLRKFGFSAISFVIPGCIPDSAPAGASWSAYDSGNASAEDLLARERGEAPLCSWEELKEIQAGGEIDIQAHTMHHHLIQVAPQLVDFIHPGYDFYFYANIHVPVYYSNGLPDFTRDVSFGTPVYRNEPRLSGQRQYFDNERVREECIAFVRDQGGEQFFGRSDWRKTLSRVHRSASEKEDAGSFETREDTEQAILEDLTQCRATIERQLGGAKVTQLCLPWFIGSELTVRMAERAGYEVLYWGVRADTRTNRPGGDPMRIVRLEDRYIFRLPGRGRRSLAALLADKVGANLPRFRQRLSGS